MDIDNDVKTALAHIVDEIEIDEKRIIDQEIIRISVQNAMLNGTVELLNGIYCFFCPHCFGPSQVLPAQVACKIFRHAVYVKNNMPINPHMPEAQCNELVAQNAVRGCAKPFEFIPINGGFMVQKCGYK